MKYSMLAACGAVTLASAMTLSAQTPTPPATQTPAPTLPAMTNQSSVTVTGCLKTWDATMGDGAAHPMAKPGDPMAKPGAPMASTRWLLTSVQADKATGQTPSQMPSAGAAGTAASQASQYVVTAGTGVNLSAHVNHQVRITGTVGAAMDHSAMDHAAKPGEKPMARPDDVKPAPGMAADRMADDRKSATLTATSVAMISATCPTTAQQ
jgi:hypothetical protein